MKTLRSRATAFTVLEMLVASLLLSILSILLFQALDNVTKITSRFQGKGTIYQDTRMVLDQLTRDIQQAIPYSSTNAGFEAFHAISGGQQALSELHFIASIDNNKGAEEVEVHYIYDGENTLWRSAVFYDSGFWNIDTAGNWYTTPASGGGGAKYDYYPILDGVDTFTIEMWNTYPPTPGTGKITWLNSSNDIPSYVEVRIESYDRYLQRRWGTAQKIRGYPGQTNQIHTFNALVQLPLSN